MMTMIHKHRVGEAMRREQWQAAVPAFARRVTTLTLLVTGVTLLLAGCGRIPESVAGTLSAPTVAPTSTARPAAPTSAGGGAGGTGGASGTVPSAPVAFKLAEMPTGNADGGRTIYMTGCANCHGMAGAGGGGNQVALVGNGGLIVAKNLDTASKFATAVTTNAAHGGIKDNDQLIAPQRLTNMYAYLVAQLNG